MHLRLRHRKPAVVADDAARQQRRRKRQQQQRQRQEQQRQAEIEAEELARHDAQVAAEERAQDANDRAEAHADAYADARANGQAAVRLLPRVFMPVAKVAVFVPAAVVCATALHYITWFPAFRTNYSEDGLSSFWLNTDLRHFLAWLVTIALVYTAAFVWGDFLVWWPRSADVAVSASVINGALTWHVLLDPAASERFAVGVIVGTVVLAVFACFSKAVAAAAQFEHDYACKPVALLMTRGMFLLCGVGVALVSPSKRFDLLFGCVFGAELTAYELFRHDPVRQLGPWDFPKVELAVSAVAVAAMCVFAEYVAWFTLIPCAWAAVTWLEFKQGEDKAMQCLQWLQTVSRLPTKLRRACRVAWFNSRFGGGGLRDSPSGAQCCVCWEGFSEADGMGTEFTVCVECGLGVPSPMSYACEPCRTGWLRFQDACPVCLASGWPVVVVRPIRRT